MRRPLGRTVLVPVANPASVLPLLRCAARLARADEGCVVLVAVVATIAEAEEQARAWASRTDLEAAGSALGVEVRTCTVRAETPADGVLEAIDAIDATLVLMGWRGQSSTSNVFGVMIDRVVGRSSVPLAVVRIGTDPFQRVLLPVNADHLLPGGDRGIRLAAGLASRLADGTRRPLTVLRTGVRKLSLPEDLAVLGDRIHHDPRRTDQAVGAMAGAKDLVVAAVAPTASGLRAATTHLAWAAPEATLMVAIDVGPRRQQGLVHALDAAGRPAPRPASADPRARRVVVTVRLPDRDRVHVRRLDEALRSIGETEHVMAWWPPGDPMPHIRATITIVAASVNDAMAAVMRAVDRSPVFRGTEITYDLDRQRGGDEVDARRVHDVTLVGRRGAATADGDAEAERYPVRPPPASS